MELTDAQQSPDLADRIKAYANVGGGAAPDDLKLYRSSSGSHINAWTISPNQGSGFLQTVYNTPARAAVPLD